MKIAAIIICVPIIYCVSSCSKSNNNGTQTGVLLGYSAEGIVALDMLTGKFKIVLDNDGVHRWNSPVYDKNTGQLFITDRLKENCIYRWNGHGIPQILYAAPQGHEILGQMTLSPTGKSLAFVESWGDRSSYIIKIISTDNVAVADVKIKGGVYDLKWISDDAIIGRLNKLIDGKVHKTLVEWTVSSGQSRELKDMTDLGLAGGIWIDVAESGKNIIIADDQEKKILHVAIYELATMKPLVEYTDNDLPGYANGWVCSTGGTKIAIFRQRDPMFPIGTYIIDINNKQATQITNKRISDMIYISDWDGVPGKKSESGSKPSE